MSRDDSIFDMSAGDDIEDWGSKPSQKRKPAPPAAPRAGSSLPKTTPAPRASGATQTQKPAAVPRATPPVPARQPAPARQQQPTLPSQPRPATPHRPSAASNPGATAPAPRKPVTPPSAQTSAPSADSSGAYTSRTRRPAPSLPTGPSYPTGQQEEAPRERIYQGYNETETTGQGYADPHAVTPATHIPPPPINAPVYDTPSEPYPAPGAEVSGPTPQASRPNFPPVAQPASSYDEDFIQGEDDEDEEESPASKRGKQKPNAKKKSGKGKNSKSNKPDIGGKAKANLIRGITLGLLGILCLLGVRSVIFPPQFPSPDQVLDKVQEGMQISNFPAERAEGFVLAFSRAYLTIPNDGSSRREEEMAQYVPTSVLSDIKTALGSNPQHIIDGPYVSGVRYEHGNDDEAVFTVAARLNNGYWTYIEVPVYHNPQTRAFAISGVPAIVSQPQLSSVPEYPLPWERDDDITDDIRTYLNSFFEAWSSNEENKREELSRIHTTNDANPRALSGIQGVNFAGLNEIIVSTSQTGEGAGQDVRIARANVSWEIIDPLLNEENENAPPSDEIRPTRYDMTYELILVRGGDDTQWKVRDIRGGVRSITGGSAESDESTTNE